MANLYIIANWKMNLTLAESVDLARAVISNVKIKEPVKGKVIVCPSFPNLWAVADIIKENENIALGAQNVSDRPSGAYTGEVSAAMLANVGCKYVIVGHSERRQYFAETNNVIHDKVEQCLANKLTPIICVGETKEEREKGSAENVVKEQVKQALAGITLKDSLLIIAYEPIWAISPGAPASSVEVEPMKSVIEKSLSEIFTPEQIRQCAIVYGGSVDANNVSEFVGPGRMNGVLVGKDSLSAEDFSDLVTKAIALYE